ncbi:MAG: hypothetical protein K6G37_01970 [Bacilli bacterium]|nr:hypothetical protein [Bacilli bacterium]
MDNSRYNITNKEILEKMAQEIIDKMVEEAKNEALEIDVTIPADILAAQKMIANSSNNRTVEPTRFIELNDEINKLSSLRDSLKDMTVKEILAATKDFELDGKSKLKKFQLVYEMEKAIDLKINELKEGYKTKEFPGVVDFVNGRIDLVSQKLANIERLSEEDKNKYSLIYDNLREIRDEINSYDKAVRDKETLVSLLDKKRAKQEPIKSETISNIKKIEKSLKQYSKKLEKEEAKLKVANTELEKELISNNMFGIQATIRLLEGTLNKANEKLDAIEQEIKDTEERFIKANEREIPEESRSAHKCYEDMYKRFYTIGETLAKCDDEFVKEFDIDYNNECLGFISEAYLPALEKEVKVNDILAKYGMAIVRKEEPKKKVVALFKEGNNLENEATIDPEFAKKIEGEFENKPEELTSSETITEENVISKDAVIDIPQGGLHKINIYNVLESKKGNVIIEFKDFDENEEVHFAEVDYIFATPLGISVDVKLEEYGELTTLDYEQAKQVVDSLPDRIPVKINGEIDYKVLQDDNEHVISSTPADLSDVAKSLSGEEQVVEEEVIGRDYINVGDDGKEYNMHIYNADITTDGRTIISYFLNDDKEHSIYAEVINDNGSISFKELSNPNFEAKYMTTKEINEIINSLPEYPNISLSKNAEEVVEPVVEEEVTSTVNEQPTQVETVSQTEQITSQERTRVINPNSGKFAYVDGNYQPKFYGVTDRTDKENKGIENNSDSFKEAMGTSSSLNLDHYEEEKQRVANVNDDARNKFINTLTQKYRLNHANAVQVADICLKYNVIGINGSNGRTNALANKNSIMKDITALFTQDNNVPGQPFDPKLVSVDNYRANEIFENVLEEVTPSAIKAKLLKIENRWKLDPNDKYVKALRGFKRAFEEKVFGSDFDDYMKSENETRRRG